VTAPESLQLMGEELARRRGLVQAMRDGTRADRHNANKWEPLYRWFRDELGVGTGAGGGPVIGKVITETKQIGNRIDEMAKTDPRYAVISLLPGVTSDKVLSTMRKRASLPSLRCVLFLDDLTPSRLVVFDD
jgi:hypothetical protein